MAATLAVPPKTRFLDQDDNWLALQTDLVGVDYPTVSLSVNDSAAPTAGQTFRLTWAGFDLIFTFATVPDSSGLQLPLRGGATAADYRATLISVFQNNAIINTEWDLVNSANNQQVRFVYRTSVALTPLSTSTNATGMAANVSDTGSDPEQQPNLRAFLQVFLNNEQTPHATLEAAYNLSDKRAYFNLGSLLGLEPDLPRTSSIGASVAGVNNYSAGFSTATTAYYLRYADKYGAPPTPELLTLAGPYYAVAGGSAGDSPMRWGAGSGTNQVCHAYLTEADNQFVKPIGFEQPDWVYFFTRPGAAFNVTVRGRIYYTDGTTEDVTPPGIAAAIALNGNALYYFPSGPEQLGLSTATDWTNKVAYKYDFRLLSDDTLTEYAVMPYRFLPECAEWERFVAYANGVGGIETVSMRGKTVKAYAVNRSAFRRTRTPSTTAADGELLYFDQEAQQALELRSGFLPRAYVEHLRQMLIGDCWLVDKPRGQFIRLTIENDSLEYSEDDQDLYAITLTARYATPDKFAHRL